MKKFTRASLKSFIKKNKDNLYIRVKSSFDGMTDCVETSEDQSLTKVESFDFTRNNDFGINGLWLVGGSRDRFEVIDNKVEVYNCCGKCLLVAI